MKDLKRLMEFYMNNRVIIWLYYFLEWEEFPNLIEVIELYLVFKFKYLDESRDKEKSLNEIETLFNKIKYIVENNIEDNESKKLKLSIVNEIIILENIYNYSPDLWRYKQLYIKILNENNK